MGTDGRTYMTKLIVAFCNLANVPKNCHTVTHLHWNMIILMTYKEIDKYIKVKSYVA